MSINYYLTLAADIPPATMLERVAPCLPQQMPAPHPYNNCLSLDLSVHCGFHLDLCGPQKNKYVGGSTDDGEWSWELPMATSLSFLFAKFYDGEPTQAENILRVVAQVLATGEEDLAFTFEYERVYLLRQDGIVTKHFREPFWNHYPLANQLIPG